MGTNLPRILQTLDFLVAISSTVIGSIDLNEKCNNYSLYLVISGTITAAIITPFYALFLWYQSSSTEYQCISSPHEKLEVIISVSLKFELW